MTTTVDGKRLGTAPVAVDRETGRTLGRITLAIAGIPTVRVETDEGYREISRARVRIVWRPYDKQGEAEPFDVSRDWEERA